MADLKTFVVLYRAPVEAQKAMQAVSPEDAKKGMEPWMKWKEECGSSLVDLGAPLWGGVKLNPDGEVPGDSTISGYSILQAADRDGAVKLLKNHPHLSWTGGCEIEVFEAQPLPG